jgi:ribokinase
MKSIVVVGSLNLDLVAYISRMPAEGETLTGNDFATFPGGKGANQAVAAARLGANVSMVGRLGDDGFGEQLRQALKKDNVDATAVLSVDKPTGSAVILVTDKGGNSIVVIPGANHALTPAELDKHASVLQSASVVLAQLEVPMETVVRLGEIAAEHDIPFILDPAPAQELPAELLKNVTWITPNETETQLLLGYLGQPMGNEIADEASASIAADRLLATGVRNVILKLGSRGVYLKGADVDGVRVQPFQVQAVDTTAAGDAFNGGFAYALTQGETPAEAARFACAVAAVSVTRAGAQPSMPTLEDVTKLLNMKVPG